MKWMMEKMENNLSNGMEEIISTLYNYIQDSWEVPMSGGKCWIEKERTLDMLDELRANIPNDIKAAQEIVERRNEILSSGKREAEIVRKQAEEYARQLVNESDIVVASRKKANEIISMAENRSNELKKVASIYCEDAMKNTEESLVSVLENIRKARQQFRSLSTRHNEEQE